MQGMDRPLYQNDPILEKVCVQIPQPVLHSTHDVFHDMISCIIEQQIHYRSTKRIFEKAMERASIRHVSLDNFHEFEKFGLSQIALSNGKYETLMQFVEFWQRNNKDFNCLSDDEVVKELSSIKGIGKWSMDMILLYTLQRPNVFPYDDFHLKQIMVSLYRLDPRARLKSKMIEISELWGPQKSMAVLYLLAYKKYISKNVESKD